jgi:hypothetical protein
MRLEGTLPRRFVIQALLALGAFFAGLLLLALAFVAGYPPPVCAPPPVPLCEASPWWVPEVAAGLVLFWVGLGATMWRVVPHLRRGRSARPETVPPSEERPPPG